MDAGVETGTLKRWAQLYFNPSGRIGRREWWLHGILGVIILAICGGLLTTLGVLAGLWGGAWTPVVWAIRIVLLPTLIAPVWAFYALGVKRMHDTNRSAWLFIGGIVAAAGGVAAGIFVIEERFAVTFSIVMWFIWMAWQKGDPGPNRYG